MSAQRGLYFSPSSFDETQKRIVLLLDGLQLEQEMLIRSILAEYAKQDDQAVREIGSQAAADRLLLKCTPAPEVRQVARLSVVRSHVPPQSNPAVKMMTYPLPPARGGKSITSDDYNLLDEGRFLNDVIIEFYLRYLVQNILSDSNRRRTHLFSSFFYRRLTHRKSKKNTSPEDLKLLDGELRHSRVKTWTRHVDIFEKDFLIIPINENSHWFLAVICFPYLEGRTAYSQPEWTTENGNDQGHDSNGESSRAWTTNLMEYCRDETMEENCEEMDESVNSSHPRLSSDTSSPVKQPCILIFDSFKGPSRGRVVTILRQYLRFEWEAKKKTKRSFDKSVVLGSAPKVPQQTNLSDCGIYLLQFAESFFEKPIEDYAIPIRKLKQWFTEERVNKKRKSIQKLIHDLMIEQHGRDVREKCTDEESSQLEA